MPVDPDDIDLEHFRRRARAWLEEHTPAVFDLTEDDPGFWVEARRFQCLQHAAGFSGITWPERYGGHGLTPAHQQVFNQEAAGRPLPSHGFQITLAILGMTVLDHGTEDQKQRYLPEILRGDALWVQLLSEPAAGSDLAAVRMRAERDGDEWVLNGEKVWSTYAQWSDYAMVLARTDWDLPKHAGLTMFIVPFNAPGLQVLPLKQMNGEEEFCQEFLDDVRVPHTDVLGGLNRGWEVTTTLFHHSRSMTSGSGLTAPVFHRDRGGDPDAGRDLIDHINHTGLGADPTVRHLLAEVVIGNTVSGLLAARVAADPNAHPAAATMAKMFGSETIQRRAEIELQIRAETAVAWPADNPAAAATTLDYLKARTASVAGGTTEVMKNTIAERILGLPREPTPDNRIPFRETTRPHR